MGCLHFREQGLSDLCANAKYWLGTAAYNGCLSLSIPIGAIYWKRRCSPPNLNLFLLLIIVSSVASLLPTLITGQIIDNGFPSAKNSNGNFNLLMFLLGASLALFVFSGLLGVLQDYINTWMSQHIVFDMRNQMFRHLEYMAYRFFTNEKQGELITRMTSDVDGVQQVVSGTLINLFSNFVTLIAALIALFSTNWQLAILGLFIVPFMIIPTRIVGRKQFDIVRQNYKNLGRNKDNTPL